MTKYSKIPASLLVVGAMLLVATIAVLSADGSRPDFEGVWRTAEVIVPGPSPQTFKPVATLAIFHGRHYSRVEVHSEGARAALKDPASASADELRAVWGPFVAEAGTFDLSGNVLTMQALVAKNPAAMMHGAFTTWSFKLSGDTLLVTAEANQNGPISNPVTLKAVRVE